MTHRHYSVPCPIGALSLMPCPPAHGADRVFQNLRAHGLTDILSMLPMDESEALGMEEEAELCAAAGLNYLSYPIADFGLPQTAPFARLIRNITTLLASGAYIGVHCRAGIGRSGMVAACTLVALGEAPEQAQKIVSLARGVSIPDTVEQGDFIVSFAAHLGKEQANLR